jgi:hypothetical protein
VSTISSSQTPDIGQPILRQVSAPGLDSESQPSLELSAELRSRLVSMTAELFPGPIRIESDVDPEFPEVKRLVVEVEGRGELRELVQRELQWHDRMWELVGKEAGMRIGICVYPQ